MQRLFMFRERSTYEGTQWVVFEANDTRLWACVTNTIRVFLHGQWRAGALVGRTEEEAFFVTSDTTTMTQDDILSGRLICEIGIAPVWPAEFVVLRILQNTAEAQRQEQERLLARDDPYTSSRFLVEADNIARVAPSDFNVAKRTVDPISGCNGIEHSRVRKIVGLTECGTVTMKHGVTLDTNAHGCSRLSRPYLPAAVDDRASLSSMAAWTGRMSGTHLRHLGSVCFRLRFERSIPARS